MTAALYLFLLVTAHQGRVTFEGLPVPGATVTATQGKNHFSTVTDLQGIYSFIELADEPFTIQVEMSGFYSSRQDVNGPNAAFELKMLPIEEMRAEIAHAPQSESSPPAVQAAPKSKSGLEPKQSDFQKAQINVTDAAAARSTGDTSPSTQSGAFANLSPEDLNQRAADGFLINGSVNNGAASPFAQFARIGNGFRMRSLYNGGANLNIDNSALNARSYSLTGQNTPEPSYNRLTASFNFGGPLRIPYLINDKNLSSNFFINYQRVQNKRAETATGRMPTEAERNGNFSQSYDRQGLPVQILDPNTGLPFSGNIIAPDRISPQSKALLELFPLPNFIERASYNYQIPVIAITHQDLLQARINESINPKNQLIGSIELQSARSDSSNIFEFLDKSRSSTLNSMLQWTMRPSQRFTAVFRYQFGKQSTHLTPYFSGRTNVSGMAGISGNNQDALNWGPPTLVFAGGISSLSDGQFSSNRIMSHLFASNNYWMHGRHNVTFGAEIRRSQLNIFSQQDARGTFTFTDIVTGYDFAGFLLGIPDTSSIAFGNADKYLRQTFAGGFIADDFRISGSLTINIGARWEYESPVNEKQGRLANLDLGPDFKMAETLTGNGLVQPDRFGVQPRISFAWRPFAASSLIVRGGYGIYRNTNVYQAIAMQMAQQSPFSKSLSRQNIQSSPFTLANGFTRTPGATLNTFAVDPRFRVGYAQNWQLSIQRDMPAAMQMTVLYLGSKGTRLPQEVLPNTSPSGTTGPAGFVYLSSNGNSIRHAGQIQLRRRLRDGFTATMQYTYSRAFDNAPLMSGGVVTANQGGASIAQNWLDLHSERAPSSFDQRHQMSVQVQYTTGLGVRGGSLLSGWRGAAFKGWASSIQLTYGSGQPLNPVYFAPVKGTGVTGNLRPDVTGVAAVDAPPGLFLNPAAYKAPDNGQWGNAGRNSISGPAQFGFNSSFGRSFIVHDRYNIDFRVDAVNVLNHRTTKSWNTTVGSIQFGLPNQINPMRSILTNLRLRF